MSRTTASEATTPNHPVYLEVDTMAIEVSVLKYGGYTSWCTFILDL
jgi:hypothetical protein